MVRLFRVFIPKSILVLVFAELVLLFACYIAAAYFVGAFITSEFDPVVFLLNEHGFLRIGLVVCCIMLGTHFQNLYTDMRTKSGILLFQQICIVVGSSFLLQALLSYVRLSGLILPKWVMIIGGGLTLPLLPAWRFFYSNIGLNVLGFDRVLYIGTSPILQEVAAYVAQHPELGLVSVGYVSDGSEPLAQEKLLGPLSDLASVVAEHTPRRIVVGMTERRQKLPVTELLQLRFSGIRIEDAFETYQATFGRVPARELRPAHLIFSTELGPRPRSLLLNSIFWMPVTLIMAILFLPIMLVVTLVVRLSSPGPVLYRQERVGIHGAVFTVYKFRSMYIDAEAKTGAVWATKNDPRVTPLGRWLRKLRLDELPQLFNVLRGEMSIVGPRPERPDFVRILTAQIPHYAQRHCVKPGITGWAQINHKYGDTLEDALIKLEYDLYYIKNLSLTLDAYIMFHTLKVMLFSETAQ